MKHLLVAKLALIAVLTGSAWELWWFNEVQFMRMTSSSPDSMAENSRLQTMNER